MQYPTAAHQHAAQQIIDFFARIDGIDAVLLVNSCSRGKATQDSCLDIVVFVSPSFRDPGYSGAVLERDDNKGTTHLYRAWEEHPETQAAQASLSRVGRFSEVHLDLTDGTLIPVSLDRDQGLDDFEISIGNYFVYSHPLWLGSDRFVELQASWLPYYAEDLRAERLAATREFCLYFLDHIEPYIERGLYFQAVDRLYNALQGFLQGLFISRRRYPIAYNKWIREQVEEILGMPELYRQLPAILEIKTLESYELVEKARRLRDITERHLIG